MTAQTEISSGGGRTAIERVLSYVPGLDAILGGGLLRGGLYMIQGSPGMGKTILASQILYSQPREESRAIFFTVLGESHGRLMMHMRELRFFDESRMPDQICYVSAYSALEDDGLKGLSSLIIGEIKARRATMLVLDGMSAVTAKAGAGFGMKKFIHELETLASATNCTMLLLTTPPHDIASAEQTMVDGLIELRERVHHARTERRLLVRKMRGSRFLEGEHPYHITDEGISVFPRVESLFALPTPHESALPARLSSGIGSLDVMLGGGLPAATMTALMGPSGAGKTTLGLHFISGSHAAEPGLWFGCYESPDRLRFRASSMGLDLSAQEQRGEVELLWYPVGEHILDRLAHQLFDEVRRRGVKRLVIDGISGFQQAALEPERVVRFWSALSHELRALGVTTLHTWELPDLTGTSPVPVGGMSSLAEVMILLRYVEVRSRLYRLISMFKMREGASDPAIRQFTITEAGIVVGTPFEGVEAVLSGMAREVVPGASAGDDSERSHDARLRPE